MKSLAIVFDRQRQSILRPFEDDHGGSSCGVLDDIMKGLLNNAVNAGSIRIGQEFGIVVSLNPNRQSGSPDNLSALPAKSRDKTEVIEH
jgi:hypothetical protein